MDAAVHERFRDRQVRIVQFDVFSDERYRHFAFRIVKFVDHLLPFGEIGSRVFQRERFAHRVSEPFVFHLERHFVDGPRGEVLDNVIRVDVAKRCESFAGRRIDRFFGSEHDDIRLDAELLQLFYRMLRRLCF